jgi:hydrogenase expression/formation protein HypE
MNRLITLHHGSGGKQAHEIILSLFAKRFGMSEPLTDSAILKEEGYILAFTTDSYVVDPLFFAGGNIGKLAVCGTVNDLAVSGAVPQYISASFIIEEGFPLKDMEIIADSMADEARYAGVRIVTGDTKVVGKGKCDKLFITTAGTGLLKKEFEHISSGRNIRTGDRLIVSGSLGNHAIAVLGARNNLSFSSPVVSDCASLNHLIQSVLNECTQVHFMRDLTRGGLATVLYELVPMSKSGVLIEEASIPVDDPVKGLCEVLGFDPYYLANEGKILIVAGNTECEKILDILQSHPLGKNSSVIGEITDVNKGSVVLNPCSGGKRILDIPSGIQLPRIC